MKRTEYISIENIYLCTICRGAYCTWKTAAKCCDVEKTEA